MIYEKLAKIQSELFVPKGNRNDFGKYNYRSCEDILKTVKPLCEKNKAVLYMTNDLEEVGGRIYVKATASLIDLEDGTQVNVTAHAREEETKKGMDGSQITGSCLSYARKYALAGLFCIDNEKDSDATNTHDDLDKKITKEKAEILENLLSQEQKEGIYSKWEIKKLSDLTNEQYGKVMRALNERKENGK